jgi:hypothetical protein
LFQGIFMFWIICCLSWLSFMDVHTLTSNTDMVPGLLQNTEWNHMGDLGWAIFMDDDEVWTTSSLFSYAAGDATNLLHIIYWLHISSDVLRVNANNSSWSCKIEQLKNLLPVNNRQLLPPTNTLYANTICLWQLSRKEGMKEYQK